MYLLACGIPGVQSLPDCWSCQGAALVPPALDCGHLPSSPGLPGWGLPIYLVSRSVACYFETKWVMTNFKVVESLMNKITQHTYFDAITKVNVIVVYFDQQTGGLYTILWSKYTTYNANCYFDLITNSLKFEKIV